MKYLKHIDEKVVLSKEIMELNNAQMSEHLRRHISFEKKEVDTIRNYFRSYKNTEVEDRSMFGSSSYLHGGGIKVKRSGIVKYVIYKCDDDWFIVYKHMAQYTDNYKCDSIEFLLKFFDMDLNKSTRIDWKKEEEEKVLKMKKNSHINTISNSLYKMSIEELEELAKTLNVKLR